MNAFDPDSFYLNGIDNAIKHSLVFSLPSYISNLTSSTDSTCDPNLTGNHEEILCAIISTYRLSWEYLIESFPCFFSENNLIPLLILHGEKTGVGLEEEEEEKHLHGNAFENVKSVINNEERDTEDLVEDKFCRKRPRCGLPSTFNFRNLKIEAWEVETQLQSTKVKQTIAGVHHPKYMLIFTTQGLHVCITTANFTPGSSTDASWVQFFPKSSETEKTKDALNNSHFGWILQDFISRQSEQLVSLLSRSYYSHDRVWNWVKRYVCLTQLALDYDFSMAEADLISTVPCRQPLPELSETEIDWIYQHNNIDITDRTAMPCSACLLEVSKLQKKVDFNDSILYGSRRLNELLFQHQDKKSEDRSYGDLIIQQTSIGNSINYEFIGSLLQHLMPEAEFEGDRLEHVKIIWPTAKKIEQVLKEFCTSSSSEEELSEGGQGGLFFHPQTFALMEPDIHTQFYTFETQRADVLKNYSDKLPHIKVYCRQGRLLTKTSSVERKECTCIPLLWSWLTSACLSRGAHGRKIPYSLCSECRHIRRGYWEYSNFELGVLLHSSPSKDYRALSEDCPVHSKNIQVTAHALRDHTDRKAAATIISLPLPFDINAAQSYCDANGKLCHLPYFHMEKETRKYHAYGNESNGALEEDVAKGAVRTVLRRRQAPPLNDRAALLLNTTSTNSTNIEPCSDFNIIRALDTCIADENEDGNFNQKAIEIYKAKDTLDHSFPGAKHASPLLIEEEVVPLARSSVENTGGAVDAIDIINFL